MNNFATISATTFSWKISCRTQDTNRYIISACISKGFREGFDKTTKGSLRYIRATKGGYRVQASVQACISNWKHSLSNGASREERGSFVRSFVVFAGPGWLHFSIWP